MADGKHHQRGFSSSPPPTVPVAAEPADLAEPTTPESPAVRRSSFPPPSDRGLAMADLMAFDEDTETGPLTLPPAPAMSAGERSRGMLTVMGGVQAGRVFVLDDSSQLIGRARDAHINIDDPGVSRRHALVERTPDGGFQVRDLRSTNGVYLNGVRVDRDGSERLSEGDRLQFGPALLLRFSLPDAVEEQLARQLYEASTRDALTSLYNRKYFTARLAAESAYAERHRTPLGVLLFDIDHFKRINDEHGHAVGDLVIRRVAGRVERSIRREDVLARWGGEEFALLVRGLEAPALGLFAERLRRGIEDLAIPVSAAVAPPNASIRAGTGTNTIRAVKVTASVGVASWSELAGTASASGDASDVPATLLGLADARLYGGKRGGRNRVVASGDGDSEMSA
jgi:diguanylate cyclase (GGDEF)-like protein